MFPGRVPHDLIPSGAASLGASVANRGSARLGGVTPKPAFKTRLLGRKGGPSDYDLGRRRVMITQFLYCGLSPIEFGFNIG
jgi:hypothetical protein